MSVDELEGRELDAAVAREVMGWRRIETPYSLADHLNPADFWQRPDGQLEATGPRHYSTRIRHAWDVLEEIQADFHGGDMTWERDPDYGFGVTIWLTGDDEVHSVSQSAPEAICRAALKAVRA